MMRVDPVSYSADYELLELDDCADWQAARASYQRLVHIWHPDKFAQRPREKPHAQDRFISLTTAYNQLRHYYRKHGHLPFENLQSVENADPELKHGEQEREAASQNPASQTRPRAPFDHSQSVSSTQHPPVPSGRSTRRWILFGLMAMLFTIVYVMLKENSVHTAILERGREILSQTPDSEFLENPSKIRETQVRDALLRGTQQQ